MAQVSFGTILRNERERKQYDIPTVARRLRIRPDILQSIEASDFDRMPPRGYARNMVNAYARYLGLNPTEITRLYLDEAYAHQVKVARSHAQPTGFDMSQAPTNRRTPPRPARPAPSQERQPRMDESSGRMVYIDDRNSRLQVNDMERLYPEERTHRSTRSAIPSTQYTNFYAGPKAPGAILSKLPLIIAGVVILALIIVLLVFFLSPKGESADDIQKVPVTGVTENNEAPQQQVETAPTRVVFTYDVLDGQAAWIEVYLGDETLEAGEVAGPAKKSYDVSGAGVLRFDTANPDGVKVYVDNVEVPLTDDDGDGVYDVTVDFPAILAQWHVDHPADTSANTTPDTSGTTEGSGTTE